VVCASFIDPLAPPAGVSIANLYALVVTSGSGVKQGGVCSEGQAPGDTDRCLWGVSSFSYVSGTNGGPGVVTPVLQQAAFGSYLSCYDATVPNVAMVQSPVDPDSVFDDGFETAGPDVRVEIVTDSSQEAPIESLNQLIGSSVSYRVRIVNASPTAISRVRLREFVPGASGAISPTVSAVSCSELLATGTQDDCPASSALIDQDITLDPEQVRTFRLVRQVVSEVPMSASTGALLAVAAFVDPAVAADAKPEDNLRSIRIGTQSVPTFEVTATVVGGNGGVSPTSQQVAQGQAATVALQPSANYLVSSVTDNCGSGGASAGSVSGTNYVVPNITAACSVTAGYVLRQYEVTAAVSGSNGSISPATQQINHGAIASFSVTPAVGYFASFAGSCGAMVDNGGGSWSTATGVTGPCNVTASFSLNQYVVTPTVIGGNGTISPASAQTVSHGGNVFFSLTPNENYRIAQVVGCGGVLKGSFYLISNLSSSCTVEASFALVTYPMTAAAVTNGSITINTPNVVRGSLGSFEVTPAIGYSTNSVTGTPQCGTLTDQGDGDWTAGPIMSAGCQVSASFVINQYPVTVTTSGNNGGIGSPSGSATVVQQVNHGARASLPVQPSEGYRAVFNTTAGTCVFEDPEQDGTWTSSLLTGACSADVSFVIRTYTVTGVVSSAGGSGTITSQRIIEHFDSGLFIISPASGFSVGTVTDNCGSGGSQTGTLIGAQTPYVVGPITQACQVTASFVANP
jgi:hypothetical protein